MFLDRKNILKSKGSPFQVISALWDFFPERFFDDASKYFHTFWALSGAATCVIPACFVSYMQLTGYFFIFFRRNWTVSDLLTPITKRTLRGCCFLSWPVPGPKCLSSDCLKVLFPAEGTPVSRVLTVDEEPPPSPDQSESIFSNVKNTRPETENREKFGIF